MAGRSNCIDRKKARQEGAAARAEQRAKRSDFMQLERLINRGHGHCKEAKRLAEKIESTGKK